MFSETLVPEGEGGGGILTPSTNSGTKDATTAKLYTLIVRHISIKNQQLDFPNFHCSIVRSCGVLDHKKLVKNGQSFEMLPMKIKFFQILIVDLLSHVIV